MRFQISNFRGISDADITVDKLTLIAGKNGNGKSSICLSMAGLLTGNPSLGLNKNQIGGLIRHATTRGMITAESDGGQVGVMLPDAKLTSTGTNPLAISEYAAGLTHIMSMTDKKRQDFISDFLKAKPTEEQLRTALQDANLSDNLCKKLWQNIAGLGWDAAYDAAQKKGAELKGQWKQITGGEAYGKNKAESWCPAVWMPDMMNATEETLQAALNEAQEWHDAAVRGTALSEAEIERLAREAAMVVELQTKLKENQNNQKSMIASISGLKKQMEGGPLVFDDMECPHCGKPVQMKNKKLVKGGTVTKSAADKSLAEHRTREASLREYEDALQEFRVEHRALENQLNSASEAGMKLVAAKNEKPVDAKNVEDAKARLEAAAGKLTAFRSRNEAYLIHEKIQRNDIIVQAMRPDGLRMTVLNEAVSKFNGVLAETCARARWEQIKSIKIDSELNVLASTPFFDECPYALLSDSEKQFVNFVFQFLIAEAEEAALGIYDCVVSYDRGGLLALLRMVLSGQGAALVAATMPMEGIHPEKMTNGKRAYWVEEGKVARLEAKAEEVAA